MITLSKEVELAVVLAVCTSPRTGEPKDEVERVRLVEGFGMEGDCHGGTERQVSLLCRESTRKMEARGISVRPGLFAENLLLDGLRVEDVGVGDVMSFSSGPVLRVTAVGKKCVSRCAIFRIAGDCVMPREGFFAEVLKGGVVRAGDTVEIRR